MLTGIRKMPLSEDICQIIRRNPLIIFFGLSFAFTWTVSLVMVGLLRQGVYTFDLIAGFGPVLSAMLVPQSLIPKDRNLNLAPSYWFLFRPY